MNDFINIERIKTLYIGLKSLPDAVASGEASPLELEALSFLYKAERYLEERSMVIAMGGFESCYHTGGCISREDYLSRIKETEDNEFSVKVYKAILNKTYSSALIKQQIIDNFESIFSLEGFNDYKNSKTV